MTKSHFSAWAAKTGLLWFCSHCRLNVDPVICDRQKIIMKALRELLIRTDSMDTRLGNYGENLRKINKTIYGSKQHDKSFNHSQLSPTFLQSIDELNFDDESEDSINRSRSCDDTSFFEVLDEVNASIAHAPEKFTIGANKRVQILTNPSSSSEIGKSMPRVNFSTPAVPDKQDNRQSIMKQTSLQKTGSNTNVTALTDGGPSKDNSSRAAPTRPNNLSLRVANNTDIARDLESFYVTPFSPDQNEEEVKQHVMDISNVHSSLVKVTKLVPRGKNIEDLSFVSFKVAVCRSVASVIGDPWYWPEGLSVRPFEPNPKNESAVRLPIN